LELRALRLAPTFALLGIPQTPINQHQKVGKKMKKYKQVKVNLNDDDYKKVSDYCDEFGISFSEFFRQKIDAKIDSPRVRNRRVKYRKIDPTLLYEINSIGVNLNQIAKYANSDNELDNDLLIKLINIEKKLQRLLDDCIN
jgi:hypothetical protein